jgi:hypothetical protein
MCFILRKIEIFGYFKYTRVYPKLSGLSRQRNKGQQQQQTLVEKQLKGLKVKSLCFLTQHHARKAYWGVEVQLHAFFDSALDGGEWSASRPGRYTPRERAPCTPWIGGWVGRRAVLDAVMKRKISSPRQKSNPRT